MLTKVSVYIVGLGFGVSPRPKQVLNMDTMYYSDLPVKF